MRVCIDIAMFPILLAALAFRITGGLAHERTGIFAAILFLMHNILNLRWHKGVLKGRFNFKRLLNTAVNFSLVILAATILSTGILASAHIFGFGNYFNGMELRQIHSLSAYWLLIGVSAHIGLHWDMILARIPRCAFLSGKIARIAWLLILPFGIWAWIERNMTGKLFLGYSFDFHEGGATLFFFENLVIAALVALLTRLVSKIPDIIFSKTKNQKEKT